MKDEANHQNNQAFYRDINIKSITWNLANKAPKREDITNIYNLLSKDLRSENSRDSSGNDEQHKPDVIIAAAQEESIWYENSLAFNIKQSLGADYVVRRVSFNTFTTDLGQVSLSVIAHKDTKINVYNIDQYNHRRSKLQPFANKGGIVVGIEINGVRLNIIGAHLDSKLDPEKTDEVKELVSRTGGMKKDWAPIRKYHANKLKRLNQTKRQLQHKPQNNASVNKISQQINDTTGLLADIKQAEKTGYLTLKLIDYIEASNLNLFMGDLNSRDIFHESNPPQDPFTHKVTEHYRKHGFSQIELANKNRLTYSYKNDSPSNQIQATQPDPKRYVESTQLRYCKGGRLDQTLFRSIHPSKDLKLQSIIVENTSSSDHAPVISQATVRNSCDNFSRLKKSIAKAIEPWASEQVLNNINNAENTEQDNDYLEKTYNYYIGVVKPHWLDGESRRQQGKQDESNAINGKNGFVAKIQEAGNEFFKDPKCLQKVNENDSAAVFEIKIQTALENLYTKAKTLKKDPTFLETVKNIFNILFKINSHNKKEDTANQKTYLGIRLFHMGSQTHSPSNQPAETSHLKCA